ncbi:ankyrin repeat domain-containing protein 35 [Trichonephila clavata]|uniref:Ankyrin repeat domain-containing protein 35 n=1 Tax=Trichonephila clavata TaxID=2740835 RepID=A0A8X6KQN2_TRICU|nr:ankyrin repeat domain-containing protein 35 [Trichonephila clavata]
MENHGIKVSNYIIQLVAEKLKRFIEDNEATFKFHPWQMSSTLEKLQKILQTELPERAIHHLWDTGTVREILNFSKNNGNPLKAQKLAQYLYAYLGLHICTVSVYFLFMVFSMED